MGYTEAITAAGGKIVRSKRSGSWQGNTLFELDTGEYLDIAFGSCAVCDNYLSMCDYKEPTQEQIIAFGKECLDNPESKDVLIAKYTKDAEWDTDADEVIAWLKETKKENP